MQVVDPKSPPDWLLQALPAPQQSVQTHSGSVILAGEPVAVVARLNGAAVRIGVFASKEWKSMAALADEPLASVTWDRLPTDIDACARIISSLSDAALAMHSARLAERATEPDQ